MGSTAQEMFPFFPKCTGRSTKARAKVQLHFNKEPSLSALMLPCNSATKNPVLLSLRSAGTDAARHLRLTHTVTPCAAVQFEDRSCHFGGGENPLIL